VVNENEGETGGGSRIKVRPPPGGFCIAHLGLAPLEAWPLSGEGAYRLLVALGVWREYEDLELTRLRLPHAKPFTPQDTAEALRLICAPPPDPFAAQTASAATTANTNTVITAGAGVVKPEGLGGISGKYSVAEAEMPLHEAVAAARASGGLGGAKRVDLRFLSVYTIDSASTFEVSSFPILIIFEVSLIE